LRPARRLSLVLAAAGALLIFPVGPLVDGATFEALGAILAVVGIGGTLASRPRTPESRSQPSRHG
jgi:hypothetical protein